ncbi:dolichyl-diphosphooligosaccharide--protein glycosyltransferase subunit 1-like, partial [Centruroides sculpturatus]|uniref:dolichyl-diphosphooligosaccharide--protein glycosyltransferase subunit 1-like n=1 Tax=Centruroides sculpturatus TaxID=218467 RepID=UPI000C6DD943
LYLIRDTQIRNFKIHLKNPLQPGKAVSVEVEHVLTQSLIPYPSHITQSEKQLVLYHGNHYFYSPYPTRIQTTTVTLASTAIESYSKLKPVSHTDNMITYGPYENVAPFSLNKMTVHYENNNPFLTVTNLERSIEVSHWGVISVEEVVDIKHSGSVLKGPFSRYEYQRDQSGFSSVRNFKVRNNYIIKYIQLNMSISNLVGMRKNTTEIGFEYRGSYKVNSNEFDQRYVLYFINTTASTVFIL